MPARTDAPYLVVLTTLGSVEDAREFVRALVDLKVVACGSILPGATSIYRWEGAITQETEAVVILKTRQECWQDLLEATQRLHPYKVPELLGVPVTNGIERYLDWVTGETLGPENKESA